MKLLAGLFILFTFIGLAETRIEIIGVSTNRPAFDFTCGSPNPTFHTSNWCYSITFKITGDVSTNSLQWNKSVGNDFSSMFPDIHHTNEITIITYPMLTNIGLQTWRLKKK